jgi:hypothetical protein
MESRNCCYKKPIPPDPSWLLICFTIVDYTEESFRVSKLVCLQPLSIQSLKVPFLLPEKNKVEKDKCIETMG